MKIIKSITNKQGNVVTTVEHLPNETLIAIKERANYTLGYPLEDEIIFGSRMLESKEVYWCDASQAWKRG